MTQANHMAAADQFFRSRPQSLAEAAARSLAGEDRNNMLSMFLDTFYGHIRRGEIEQAQASIDAEPPSMADVIDNAYFAGVAEHLARRWKLPRIPLWTFDRSRFLREPYFPFDDANAKALYWVESPIAFRRRLIFVSRDPLARATMALIDRAPATLQ